MPFEQTQLARQAGLSDVERVRPPPSRSSGHSVWPRCATSVCPWAGSSGCASPPAAVRCCARWFCWIPARDPKTPDKARRYKVMAAIYRMTGIRPLAGAVARIMFGPPFLAEPSHKPVLDEWLDRLRRSRRSAMSEAVLAVANRESVEDELAAINVPCLVIVGADDAAIPPIYAERIAAGISGARLEKIPDCGRTAAPWSSRPLSLTCCANSSRITADRHARRISAMFGQ